MAKKVPVGTESQRADNSIWKKLDSGWKQLQDGDNSSRSKFKLTSDSAKPGAGEVRPSMWARMKEQYDLDGHIPDESVGPEHVEIDTEGDIDSKPVLKWKNASGKVMKSYTRAFHTQRAYALHKECGKYHSKIMKAMDTLEGMMNKQDAGAATAYASMITGHRPSVFMGLTPDKMRVYRGDVKKSHTLDYFIEKADTRDSMHPNRFHFMVEHPSQGAFIANVYDPALADYAANGGSFAEPTEAFATVGLKDVNFRVLRAHTNMRMAADAMSKSAPVKMDDVDFHQGMSKVNQVIMNVSDAVARNYGHRSAPDGMVYLPVAMSVAAVDEAGGHRYWPDTFKKREPYIESRGDDMEDFDVDAELDDLDLDVDVDDDDEGDVEKDITDGDQDIMKSSHEGINFTPPAGVRAACRAGLKLKEEGHGGKGLVGATVAWARRLAAGQKISPAKARKMNAWFARHSVGSSSRTLGDKTSPAWVAWQLWGGNAGKAWSAKLVRQMESREAKKSMLDDIKIEPIEKPEFSVYLSSKYLKDVSPEILKSLYEHVSKEQPCDISLNEEQTSSSEPSPTPSPSPIEKSISTTTIAEESSRTASHSPEPSAIPENSPRTESPSRQPLAGLLGEPRVRQALAQAVLASSRGTIQPQSLVEALGHALLDNFDGMVSALSAGIAKAGATPGPSGAPEGTVSRYADGTVVEKRGGKWHEVKNEQSKPDSERGDGSESKQPSKKTKRAKLSEVLGKYKEKLSRMKERGASKEQIAAVKEKMSQIKQKAKMRKAKGGTVAPILLKKKSLFETWEAEKLAANIQKAATYCRYMNYSKPEQLLYAVAAVDTPAEITVAVRAATRALGHDFASALQKELSK
jgi:hypothetical protein